MFARSSHNRLRKIIIGTLLSTAVITGLAAGSDKNTYYLLDSQGQPIKTPSLNKCVLTPNTSNTPAQLLKECGEITDRDGDGIFDDDDVCPDNIPEELVKGVFQSSSKKGCPLDSDNDGVPDYRSDCLYNTPLEISNGVDARGCPIDTDQDGVPDYKDQCPNTPFGLKVDENGCPFEIVKAPIILSGDVLFAFDKAVLTPQAKTQLEELINQPEIDLVKTIEIVGHTDSIGKESYNQKLSEQRAASVANYLIKLGILASKVSYFGEGERNPIASNDTKIGRAQNRRVEIRITEYERK
jgi:OmpA-OmpF porin, OOP family